MFKGEGGRLHSSLEFHFAYCTTTLAWLLLRFHIVCLINAISAIVGIYKYDIPLTYGD